MTSDDLPHQVLLDGRSTVAVLKRRIAAKLRKRARLDPSASGAAAAGGRRDGREAGLDGGRVPQAMLLTPPVALSTLPLHPLRMQASPLIPVLAETLRLRRSARGAHAVAESFSMTSDGL